MIKKLSITKPEIITYTPKLKVMGVGELPRGTGAKYLECMLDHKGNLVAVQWRDTPKVDAEDHILIDFKVKKTSIKRETSLANLLVYQLNQYLQIDRQAMSKLFQYHVSCNQSMIHHPTIEINGHDKVGFLGILNGFVGRDSASKGLIVANIEASGLISSFQVSKQ